MDVRGTVYFLPFMLGIVFFFLGLAIAPAINQTAQEARVNADCTNSSITSFEKGGCLINDLYAPYFIAVIFGIAGALIGGKLM